MKKQLTAWLLALVMLFSLVGCGADAPVQDDSSLPQQLSLIHISEPTRH